MGTLTRRAQALLTEEQYAQLEAIARECDESISTLIREAVKQVYLMNVERERRVEAVQRMAEMNLPVSEWEEMEEEIGEARREALRQCQDDSS